MACSLIKKTENDAISIKWDLLKMAKINNKQEKKTVFYNRKDLHPVTSGICFSVVPISNPRSRFVNSQLVCLLPVGIFNSVGVYLKYS